MITRQKIVSITLLPLLSLVALVAVACPADGEAISTDAMNEPAPVTTVGDPEPVQTPEIPVNGNAGGWIRHHHPKRPTLPQRIPKRRKR